LGQKLTSSEMLLHDIVSMTQCQQSRDDVCWQEPNSRILLRCCISEFCVRIRIWCLQGTQNWLNMKTGTTS